MGMTEHCGRHHLAPQLQPDNATSLMESCCVKIIDYRASPVSAANDEYHLCLRKSVGNESPESRDFANSFVVSPQRMCDDFGLQLFPMVVYSELCLVSLVQSRLTVIV